MYVLCSWKIIVIWYLRNKSDGPIERKRWRRFSKCIRWRQQKENFILTAKKTKQLKFGFLASTVVGPYTVLNYGFFVWGFIHLFLGDERRPRKTNLFWTTDLDFGKAFNCFWETTGHHGEPRETTMRRTTDLGFGKAFTGSPEVKKRGRPRETTRDYGRPLRTKGDHIVLNYGFWIGKTFHCFLENSWDHGRPREIMGDAIWLCKQTKKLWGTTLSWITDFGFGNPVSFGRPRETKGNHGRPRGSTGNHIALGNGFWIWKSFQLCWKPRETTLLWVTDWGFGDVFLLLTQLSWRPRETTLLSVTDLGFGDTLTCLKQML